MPILKITDVGSFDVDEGQRLVRAITEAGLDIGHRCGGHASCTTCRVTFESGEPDVMTRAEYEKLRQIDQLGEMRLSCQVVVDRPMAVTPLMRASEKGWDDAGPEPEVEVTPEAAWFSREELEAMTEKEEEDDA
jgi:ferredoxin